jgi:hypothetical protein
MHGNGNNETLFSLLSIINLLLNIRHPNAKTSDAVCLELALTAVIG